MVLSTFQHYYSLSAQRNDANYSCFHELPVEAKAPALAHEFTCLIRLALVEAREIAVT
jgi:hypothetical protein